MISQKDLDEVTLKELVENNRIDISDKDYDPRHLKKLNLKFYTPRESEILQLKLTPSCVDFYSNIPVSAVVYSAQINRENRVHFAKGDALFVYDDVRTFWFHNHKSKVLEARTEYTFDPKGNGKRSITTVLYQKR